MLLSILPELAILAPRLSDLVDEIRAASADDEFTEDEAVALARWFSEEVLGDVKVIVNNYDVVRSTYQESLCVAVAGFAWHGAQAAKRSKADTIGERLRAVLSRLRR